MNQASALLLCAALTACKHEGGGVSGDGGAGFTPSPRPPTHESQISITNLDGEIADALRPNRITLEIFRRRLPDLLLERVSVLGTTTDFDLADEISAKNLVLDGDDGQAHLVRAHVLAALHQFPAALGELDFAEKHGAGDDVRRARATIFLATGRCAEAPPLWPALPYATDMAVRGAMEQRNGHAKLGETLFERARLEYGDVSPFRFSWMDFERARAFEREGDTVKARAYLEDALVVTPEYAHAAVHLASLEPPERAIAHLEVVEKRADDPDVFASHAEALRRLKRTDEAHAMTERARTRFEEVMAKHFEAYADHAARFFLGEGGDVKRALDLAKRAAATAPSEETLELWLMAARATGAPADVCAAISAADKTSCPLAASRTQFDAARKTCKP